MVEPFSQPDRPVLSPSSFSKHGEQWFEDFIRSVRIDELKLRAGVADPELHSFYELLMRNNPFELSIASRNLSTQTLTKALLNDFISLFQEIKPNPISIHIAKERNGIKTWIVIEEDDSETKNKMYKIERKMKAKYFPVGFDYSSIIFEETDEIPIPQHYKILLRRLKNG